MKFIKKVGTAIENLKLKKLSVIPCHDVLLLWGGGGVAKSLPNNCGNILVRIFCLLLDK